MYNKSVARRVMKKDPDAFRILYDDWAQRLYTYSYDILESTELAHRAVVETCCKAYELADTLKEESKLEEWLTDLCTAVCAKEAARRRLLSEGEKESLWAEIARREALCTMELEREAPAVCETPQTGEAQEEWQPIIFLPEEDDLHKTPPKSDADEKPEAAKEEKEEKPRRARSVRKAGAVLAGAVMLVGVALAGGAAVLALAGSGAIVLPASLSGAAVMMGALL